MARERPLARVIYPGAEASLREAVTRIGAGPETLMTLARTGVVEVMLLDRMRSDEARVLERELARSDGRLFSDANGERAIAVAPLAVLGGLASQVRQFSDAMEPLAQAISDALVGRGAPPPPWQLMGETLAVDRCQLLGVGPEADLSLETGMGTREVRNVIRGEALPLAAALRVTADQLSSEATRHGLVACASGVLLALPMPPEGTLDGGLLKVAAEAADLVDTLLAEGMAAARLALQVSTSAPPSVALLERVEQLRALRLPLAIDCRDTDGAVAEELVRVVLAARAGVRLLLVEHTAEALAATQLLGLR